MSLTEVGKVHERAKPELIKIGNHERTSSGKWNTSLLADFIIRKAWDRWLPIGELARVAYGSPMPRAKAQVRKNHSNLARELLRRGFLLLSDKSGQHGRIMSVKLYDSSIETERCAMGTQIEEMKKRCEYTAGQYDRAVSLLSLPRI